MEQNIKFTDFANDTIEVDAQVEGGLIIEAATGTKVIAVYLTPEQETHLFCWLAEKRGYVV